MSKQDLINRARLKVRGRLTPQKELTGKTFADINPATEQSIAWKSGGAFCRGFRRLS